MKDNNRKYESEPNKGSQYRGKSQQFDRTRKPQSFDRSRGFQSSDKPRGQQSSDKPRGFQSSDKPRGFQSSDRPHGTRPTSGPRGPFKPAFDKNEAQKPEPVTTFNDEIADDRDDEVENEGYIEGRNAVLEALKAGHPLNKVFVAKGEVDSALRRIISMAKDAGAVVIETDKRKLDFMSVTGSHQGVIAVAAVKEYCSVKDILNIAKERGETPIIIICDEVSDAHNLGAIIRTAESAGAHGVIIPKRRSAGLSAIISKTSAGAVEYMAVARVANLTSAIKELKSNGVWIYGTAADGESDIWHTDLTGPMALVIGSEGEGMRKLVSESCDFRVSIPMKGQVSSLNASASAAIVIYEAIRQRTLKK